MHLTCELIVMRDTFRRTVRPLDVLDIDLIPYLEHCRVGRVKSQNRHYSGFLYVNFIRIK